MIKKIIAMAACLSIVFAFSACGDDDKVTTTGDSATTIEEQTTEVTTEEQTGASYEVDTTEPQESSVDIVDGVLDSSYYSMEVGDDWNMTSGSDEIVFMTKKGEDSLDSTTNVSIMFSDQFAGMSSDECLKNLKSQYDAIEDYKVESAETTKIGEYDAAVVVLSTAVSDTKAKLKQVCIIGENGGAIITYTTLADIYDETISEIDDIITTIELK